MVVCRFYQQGNCRYGNTCKFEHPPKGGQQTFGQNYNRFDLLGRQQNQGMSGRSSDTPQYPGLTPEAVQRDLSTELPTWILSCYGPGKDAPEQLFGGYPREQSFEEIRLHFMQGAMAGNPAKALDDIQMAYNSAQEQIRHALSNIPAAIQYVIDGAKKHPNRIDICKGQTGGGGAFGSTANAFQSRAPSTASAFGQPGTLGQKPNPFGAPASTPAFGQPAQPTAPAFGQPAALGSSQSAFGQRAQTTGAFGQPATLGPRPSPFGAPAFGQPAQPVGAPAFGQPGFGQPSTLGAKPNPFGTPQQTTSPFGASTASTQPVANPFGQPTQPAQTANPFGQPAQAPSAFGQQTQASTGFGQTAPATAPTNNPFGQPAQQPANPFGQTATTATPASNPFGQPPQQNASPFATTAPTSTPTANPFDKPSPTKSAFGNPPPPSAPPAATTSENCPYGPNAKRQHPDINSYSVREPNNRLVQFKGKPVSYEVPKGGGREVPVMRNFDGSVTKIWNPDGPPKYTSYTEAEDAKVYEDEALLKQWQGFLETGVFVGGGMPEVPPKREFCLWDF
ncbi:hypothetical protein VTK26DRAFT_8233 [Humicola hyalothermophila]